MNPPPRGQYYTPAFRRSESSSSRLRPARDGDEGQLTATTTTGIRPRRQKSLVRPERERIDASHRQYYYRQHATNQGDVVPSTTGNQPLATTEDAPALLERTPTTGSRIERRPTVRQMFLRRGKSILGREEKLSDNEDHRLHIAGEFSDGAGAVQFRKSLRERLPDPWLTYCRILTCCIPDHLLTVFGIPPGPGQMAWREKIGLVSFILVVMGFVGFLTFGFTQAICPTPPLSVQGGEVSAGYLIINGWAYMLSDWDGHPAISGLTSDETNIMYAPVSAGGMDASFLFQTPPSESPCSSVLTSKTSSTPQVYFPCQLFNPNNTVPPAASTFSNQTDCHLSSSARSLLQQFQTQGIPKSSGGYDKPARVYYDWSDINSTSHLMVFNNDVLNLQLLQSLPTDQFSYPSGGLIENILGDMESFGGRDMTRAIVSNRVANTNWEQEAQCLASIIKVGSMDTLSIGCVASEVVLYASLVVILGVIIVKFVLAVIFGWFLSWKLGNFKEGSSYKARMEREREIEDWSRNIATSGPLPRLKTPPTNVAASQQQKRRTLLPQTSRFTQPLHGSTRFDADRTLTPIWKTPASVSGNSSRPSSFYINASSSSPSTRFFGSVTAFGDMTPPRRSSISSSDILSGDSSAASTVASCPFPLSPHVVRQPPPDYMPFNFPLVHAICLVTCYSEGEDGIRTTLDSIATSDYPNSHKLMLVICDGIITGHGNTMSTPDICISMMRDFIIPPDQVQPYSYVAIADGAKRHNMAKVYAGYYKYDDNTIDPAHQQRVPMVCVVKCGTPEEANEAKPGNRGKRDSQIVLMQFMQKVIFDERMTRMEYEFFNSIWRVTGVPPDSYEICLMVDADTKLYPDALSRLISCCVRDPEISGLCGETKIANKTDSWVSMIQVFEYYISHHQSKAFESIFGGVTCLPGCFCMYRIKAPKGPNGYWVPILANPDIVEHYSENVVDTLHKKNLLLLGEDRYLSTLMLRTFPNRKMVFVPQAVCKTVVPDTFKVLLSQRRRWINSTIHNLMELLFVYDLCGTFCFSMQFVVFMELVGTLALPAAISFTCYLIILAILGQPAIIPLILLALILGLPAVLIVMTSRKVVYVGWMIIYLFSLPIWNFVLPVYAYWHFDDFSWGDTRRVQGSEKDKGHGDKVGEFDSSQIVMKKWSEYEKERRIKLALERNLPVPRFVDHHRSVDIFTDSMYAAAMRPSKAGSAESSDSEAPLTQKEYQPAGANKQSKANNTTATTTAHVPVQLSEPEMPMTLFNTAKEQEEQNDDIIEANALPSSSAAAAATAQQQMTPTPPVAPTLPKIATSPSQFSFFGESSNWANPAPHHNYSQESQPASSSQHTSIPDRSKKSTLPSPPVPPPHREDDEA